MTRVISKSGSTKNPAAPSAAKTKKSRPKINNNYKVKKTKDGWGMTAMEALKVDYVDSEI